MAPGAREGAGQCCSPACWCKWSWGRSPHCSHRCIHQYLCKPASSVGEMLNWGPSLWAALPIPALRNLSSSTGTASSMLSCTAEIPGGPGRVPWQCTHLLAGLGIVHPHARDGVASIATGTGLAAEPRGCVDALGAREAGVGMGTLQHRERHRLHPRAQHPTSLGGCCHRPSRGRAFPRGSILCTHSPGSASAAALPRPCSPPQCQHSVCHCPPAPAGRAHSGTQGTHMSPCSPHH